MTLPNPQQFDSPVDEMGYKVMSHGMCLVRNSHNDLSGNINDLSDNIEELEEGLCLLAKKTVEIENVMAEKIVELEQGVLLGEKEMYQLRQQLEMVLATLDARGLSLN